MNEYPSESHLDKFAKLYLEFGIKCIINQSDEGYEIKLADTDMYSSQDSITLSDKFEGYGGFFTRIEFDKNGNFLKQGFWEWMSIPYVP